MADGSVIGQGTLIRGNVRGDGSIEIYGRVDGDIIVTGDVTLGENATVRGNVSGSRLTIGGTIVGELRGTDAIMLERSAQVTGDLTAPRIAIEEGARARGGLYTEEPGAPAAAPARASVAERRPAPRAEAPRRVEAPPPREAPKPVPAAKRAPPAPVVPAFRGLQGKKKKSRSR